MSPVHVGEPSQWHALQTSLSVSICQCAMSVGNNVHRNADGDVCVNYVEPSPHSPTFKKQSKCGRSLHQTYTMCAAGPCFVLSYAQKSQDAIAEYEIYMHLYGLWGDSPTGYRHGDRSAEGVRRHV